MKGYLTAIAWMVFWASFAILVPSCINIPPPSPMGDGAIQQIGLLNFLPASGIATRAPKPKATVKVSDKEVVISYPKN